MSTSAGYTGGDRKNPTYHSLGDHTESIRVTFDPALVSWDHLLDVFWKSHNPHSRAWSRQYMSAIYCLNETQERTAIESRDRVEANRGKVYTEIVRAGEFYRAEDYHQKFYLRRNAGLFRGLMGHFDSEEELLDSTLAAKLNAASGGVLRPADLERELTRLGVDPEELARIMGSLKGAHN